MKCYSPLLRIWNKGYPDDYRIIPQKRVADQLKMNPNYLRTNVAQGRIGKYECQEIPCGKCYACRLNYSAEWATRIMLEKEYYKDYECWFITLTYDDNHLVIPDTFEYNGQTFRNDGTWNGTLVKNDIQKFIKRIRRKYPNNNIKYYLCGEYGSRNLRPHYHIIILGLPIPISDLYEPYIDPKFHKEHYKSHYIDKIWGKSQLNDVSQVEWSNVAYTARYCMKKVGDSWNKEEWAKLGKIPEFVTMSRDIGRRYYEEHKDKIWKNDNMIMKTVKGNIGHCKPPKRYMNILEKQDPQLALKIKNARQQIAIHSDITENQTSDYTDLEKLLIQYDNCKKKNSMLQREL